jgi:hypothetical protein
VVKATNKHLMLLLVIFVFAFLYRFLMMTYEIYPPGSDIGLHNSVIHSIINQGGTVDFLYNNYQMGGGLSITFPGYHLFVAQIMLLTSMPEYLAHALVASLFSSVIVLASYLITRVVWTESAAIAVAFLMAISRFDIEMLLWGGYPNVVALLLIPITFYFYIQKNRFSKIPFYITTSLLIGSIFLVHSLSSLMFVSILFFAVLVCLVFGKKIETTRFEALSWLIPVVFGALIVLPYLIRIVPVYLTNQSTVEINQAILSSRVLPLGIILPLFVVASFYFLLSKKYHKHYFTVPTVLLVLWMFVPMVFTQGYLIGQYTDYNRFLYFVITPLVVLIGLFVDHGSGFFARVIDTYRTLTRQLPGAVNETDRITRRRLANFSNYINRKLTKYNLYAGFLISFLLICFFFIPVFITPSESLAPQNFYQVMSDPLYQAMNWAKFNTPADATFVTTAYYGWWFAGFAQRPTWSAVEPQFLSLSREFPVAQMATNLLNTNYVFGSSFKLSDELLYIQVQEDGGYMARHNPQILTNLNGTYLPYQFFNFNSDFTKILYSVNGVPCSVSLAQLSVKDMYMENDAQHTTVSIIKGNEYFTCTQLTTVYQGSKFVNVTTVLETTSEIVSLHWLQTTLDVNALQVGFERPNTIGFVAEGVNAFGQIIFNSSSLPMVNSRSHTELGSTEVHLDYNLAGEKQANIQMTLTTYPVTNDKKIYRDEVFSDFFNKQVAFNLEPEKRDILPLLTPFNYQAELKLHNINYVVVPNYYEQEEAKAEMKLKFANDPLFNLVFINDEVAIFEVKQGS